jgi:hypothetical protein
MQIFPLATGSQQKMLQYFLEQQHGTKQSNKLSKVSTPLYSLHCKGSLKLGCIMARQAAEFKASIYYFIT